jgi:hypothetical protein
LASAPPYCSDQVIEWPDPSSALLTEGMKVWLVCLTQRNTGGCPATMVTAISSAAAEPAASRTKAETSDFKRMEPSRKKFRRPVCRGRAKSLPRVRMDCKAAESSARLLKH